MVSGASGAARSQKAQQWKGPNTIGTRERAWQKRQRRVETCNAGRAGAHRPSEALHPTRSSDMLPRIARERVPTVPHVAKTRRDVPRRIARERVPTVPHVAKNASKCATPDRAGARPYQSQRHRLIKSANPRLLRRDAV